MPTRLLVRLQIRKSAAAGVAAKGAMVASPRQSRAGPARAGKPTRDMAACRPLAKVDPFLIRSLRHRSELERFPVMLNHFSRLMIQPAVTRLHPRACVAARRRRCGDGVSLCERDSGQVLRSNRNAL